MALKIVRKKSLFSHTKNLIWQFIQSEKFIKNIMRKDHPLIAFDPLHASDVLTFSMTNRFSDAPPMTGVAVCFDLFGENPEALQNSQFIASFNASVRGFLFWHLPEKKDIETRENLLLINSDGEIQWSSVRQFIGLAVKHLPLKASTVSEHGELRFEFNFDAHTDICPLALKINMDGLQAAYTATIEDFGHLNANKALADHLIIQLSRVMLSARTSDQAAQEISSVHKGDVKQCVNEARAMLKDPVFSGQ